MIEDNDNTMFFDKSSLVNLDSKEVLSQVYSSLQEKGYEPLNQIVGYILSGDPAYITSYNNARSMIKQIDRDKYIEDMLIEFIGVNKQGKK